MQDLDHQHYALGKRQSPQEEVLESMVFWGKGLPHKFNRVLGSMVYDKDPPPQKKKKDW